MTTTAPRTRAPRHVSDLRGPAPHVEREASPAVAYRSARLTEMPADDRPRERLERLGPESLRLDELVAILLRTGTAQQDVMDVSRGLLREMGGLRALAAADIPTLTDAHGMGPVKAGMIVAAFELGRRLSLEPGADRPQVTSPEHIAGLLHERMQVLEQEELHVLALDTKNRLLTAPTRTYRGTVNSAGARVAEVFKAAVRLNATKIALAHNHPSGDPTPSADDVELTRTVVAAGRTMDIEVLDHLVFGHGPGRWVSLRRQGLAFQEA